MRPIGPPFDAIQEASGNLLQQLYSEPPTNLYHYTSGEGLLGILQSGHLRGSNYAFMNDRSEFTYGADLLHQIVSERSRRPKDDVDQDYYEAILRETNPVISELYLVCFCTEGDLLSQWRGYGNQGSRYCLRFATTGLTAIRGASGLLPVIYDAGRQREILNGLLDSHLEGLYAFQGDRHKLFESAASCTYACCLTAFALFKDYSFREEREWRSVLIERPGNYEAQLEFASSGGVVKPHLPLLQGDDGALPLAEVICGASASPETATRSARLMLARYKYSTVVLSPSRIPLSG